MICQQRQHCARQRSHDKFRIFPHFHFFCIAQQADSRFNGSLHRLMTLSRSSFLSMFRSPIAFQSITLKHIRVCAGNLSLLKVFRFSVYKSFPSFLFLLFRYLFTHYHHRSHDLYPSPRLAGCCWYSYRQSVFYQHSTINFILSLFLWCLLFSSSLESLSHLWKTCEYSIFPFHSHIHCFFNYVQ